MDSTIDSHMDSIINCITPIDIDSIVVSIMHSYIDNIIDSITETFYRAINTTS